MPITIQVAGQGNITIPRATLQRAGIEVGDLVEVIMGGVNDEGRETLTLRKAKLRCFFCQKPLFEGKYREIRQKPVCTTCIKTIQSETEE